MFTTSLVCCMFVGRLTDRHIDRRDKPPIESAVDAGDVLARRPDRRSNRAAAEAARGPVDLIAAVALLYPSRVPRHTAMDGSGREDCEFAGHHLGAALVFVTDNDAFRLRAEPRLPQIELDTDIGHAFVTSALLWIEFCDSSRPSFVIRNP